MQFTYGGSTYRLEAGDCLALHIDGPIEFRNPTLRPVTSASQK